MVFINEVSYRWSCLGYQWKEAVTPTFGPVVIPKNGLRVIPVENYVFKGLEGALEVFHGEFDHPLCGIRVESGEPLGEYDSGTVFNIRNYIFGAQRRSSTDIMLVIPPDVPYGFYGIKRAVPWHWTGWLRLSLINIDTVDHYCFGYGYQMAIVPSIPKEAKTEKTPPTLTTSERDILKKYLNV